MAARCHTTPTWASPSTATTAPTRTVRTALRKIQVSPAVIGSRAVQIPPTSTAGMIGNVRRGPHATHPNVEYQSASPAVYAVSTPTTSSGGSQTRGSRRWRTSSTIVATTRPADTSAAAHQNHSTPTLGANQSARARRTGNSTPGTRVPGAVYTVLRTAPKRNTLNALFSTIALTSPTSIGTSRRRAGNQRSCASRAHTSPSTSRNGAMVSLVRPASSAVTNSHPGRRAHAATTNASARNAVNASPNGSSA